MGTRQLAKQIYSELDEEAQKDTSVDLLIRQIHIYKGAGYTETHLREILPKPIPKEGCIGINEVYIPEKFSPEKTSL
jgi:hypothetical protein